jgi:hypothetical protein
MRGPDLIDVRPVAVAPATLELLAWIQERERTYAETIDVWRSHCPRLTVWEDALTHDLVEVIRRPKPSRSTVLLTSRGLEILAS